MQNFMFWAGFFSFGVENDFFVEISLTVPSLACSVPKPVMGEI